MKYFSLLLLLGAVGLLGWANWPFGKINQTNQLHLIAPSTWSDQESHLFSEVPFESSLSFPVSIKTGQKGVYSLNLDGLPSKVTIDGETWHLHIRAELILPGFLNQQEGMLSQSVQNGKPLKFEWDVKAIKSINSTGTLSLFVDYISESNEVETQLLSVTELKLTSTSLLGLNTRGITSLGVTLLLLAGLIGALATNRSRM